MDTAVTTIYCVIDEFLKSQNHQEDSQRTLSDAEVMTVALVAMRYHGGNYAKARRVLHQPTYMPKMINKSQFNRRLHRLAGLFEALFEMLSQLWTALEKDDIYLIDSFPVPVCDNIRIKRCKIYQEEAFRGYTPSKRRFFYGLKVHLMTTSTGRPVEVFLTPGSESDTKALKKYRFDLPEGSSAYGDKAYNDYLEEDLLQQGAKISLLPLRKKNSKRAVPAFIEYIQHTYRKAVETAASVIDQMMPKSIHAVTAKGFELKVYLFVLAYSFDGLL